MESRRCHLNWGLQAVRHIQRAGQLHFKGCKQQGCCGNQQGKKVSYPSYACCCNFARFWPSLLPGRGNLVIRASGHVDPIVELLTMKQPFPVLKALDTEDVLNPKSWLVSQVSLCMWMVQRQWKIKLFSFATVENVQVDRVNLSFIFFLNK
jgi:hypothetical protein